MADNAKIKLILKQTADGSTDSSELFTRGEFREHGGSFFIDYDESEATGYAGSHVQLRIGQQDDTVTMTRTGKAFSSLVFISLLRANPCTATSWTRTKTSSLTRKPRP